MGRDRLVQSSLQPAQYVAHQNLSNCFKQKQYSISKSMRPSTGSYTRKRALYIYWEDHDFRSDDTLGRDHLVEEIESLEKVCRSRLGFQTWEFFAIPEHGEPQAHVAEALLDFVADCEDTGELLMVYYGGHAAPSDIEQGSLLMSARSDSMLGIDWIYLQHNYLYRDASGRQVQADILVILDCCHAQYGVRSSTTHKRNIIAACAGWQTTAEPGPLSFTSCLIEAIKSIHRTFDVEELVEHINEIGAKPFFDGYATQVRRRWEQALLYEEKSASSRHGPIRLTPLHRPKKHPTNQQAQPCESYWTPYVNNMYNITSHFVSAPLSFISSLGKPQAPKLLPSKILPTNTLAKSKPQAQVLSKPQAYASSKHQAVVPLGTLWKPEKKIPAFLDHESKRDFREGDVDGILDMRCKGLRFEYLVKWTGYREPTWEPLAKLTMVEKAIADYHERR